MKLKQSKSNQEHALLSPSAAKKWLNCSAALACEFGLPNESGQAAVNGTCMHTIAETVLNRVIRGENISADTYKGAYALNEGKGPIKALVKPEKGAVLITDDFVGQVNKYVDYCRSIIDAAEVFEVETRVNLSRDLHPGAMVQVRGEYSEPLFNEDGSPKMAPLQTFGTADLVALLEQTDGSYMLIVGDLKTGRHRVSAKENKQMMLYALGLLRVYKRLYDITAVRLVIFQPYAGGADEWDTTPEALEQFGKFAQSRALRAIDAFERGKKGLKPADFKPGSEQCQWCRFAEKCNAKRSLATNAVADIPVVNASVEMSTDQLKAEWDKLPLMRQHIADIEKAMYSALMKGEKVEGLKLVEGKPGNRAWSPETDEVTIREMLERGGLSLGTATGLMYKKSLLSPTEMEKAAPKEAWELLKGLVTRKPGQPSIATADDKRAEWTAAKDEDLEN